jgi:small subunit ribosomal protein S3
MGNKSNPTGMRVGVNKNWDSIWYADKSSYSDLVHEDIKVRDFIEKKLKSAGIHRVKIERSMNSITVAVIVARPGVVIGRGGAGVDMLKKELDRMITGRVDLKIVEVKDPDTSAKLIAETVADQVARRIVPKFAMSREIEKAQSNPKIKGIRIWISGRIKGVEIARREKAQWGRVPLHTLRADIDYALVDAQVPHAGKHGIKVWVYTGEKHQVTNIDNE